MLYRLGACMGLSIFKKIRNLGWFKLSLIAVVFIGLFMFVSIEITGQPGFCNSCHVMKPYYDNWKTSEHSDVKCLKCHVRPGIVNYAKAKITGLAQAVDCVVGRIGTKANGRVYDEACLRDGCHLVEVLETAEIDLNGIKFTHKGHIGAEVAGIEISCGTCHSHFEGDEHFTVNREVCFTCHFLYDEDPADRVVQIGCRDCHEVPDKVIRRGMVDVNHQEFVSYKANCDDSCHQRQTVIKSDVSGSICLNCHSHVMEDGVDVEELHRVHTEGEKVECFACHGDIYHGPTKSNSIAAMMDCKNCHSDTHGVQRSMFAAEEDPRGHDSGKILSPMFLTHVACTDCHIEQSHRVAGGVLDSFGAVARAVPRACDKCHEVGSGAKYIPFWQGKVKKLYQQVSTRLRELEGGLEYEDAAVAKRLEGPISEVKELLRSVESDGSWGVHNFKYSEALLLKANETINDMK